MDGEDYGLLVLSLALCFLAAKIDIFPSHACAKDYVPMNEEWLREIAIDSNDLMQNKYVVWGGRDQTYLMMNVMIVRRVSTEHLQGIPREAVPAVIIHCLQGRYTEQEHSFANGHPRKRFCQDSSDSIQEESLDGMIVKGPKCIRDVKAMMY